jgi:signal transduction histidine kinase
MLGDDRKTALLQKIAEGKFLPSFSALAVELIDLAADEKSSAQDLASVIEKDAGLATRLLKLAGAAFFARQTRVTSIPQAVVLLGFKRVRIMALSLALTDAFPVGKTGAIDYRQFWKTSLYRALVAQDLARGSKTDRAVPEEAFAGALILDIGKAMLYEAIAAGQENVGFPDSGQPLEEVLLWEKARWGLHHREAGRFVLGRWHFPEPFLECQSHVGAEALKNERSALCKTVELARRATDFVFGLHTCLDPPLALIQALLHIDAGSINDILSETFRNVEELSLHLRMDFVAQAEIFAVMDKATQALARIGAAMEDSLDHAFAPEAEHPESLSGADDTGVVENILNAVAHEIRNPLTAIGGFARRLALAAQEDSRIGGYAKIIEAESARLERTLKDMIEYSQPLQIRSRPVDVTRLIEDVLGKLAISLKEKPILLKRNFENGPSFVAGDPDALTKMLIHLVAYAVASIDQGPGTLQLSFQRLAQGTGAAILISHTGRPMAEEDREALVTPNLTTRSFGSGLGLPLARKIIQAHGGSIALREEKGFTSTMVIHLPNSR